MRADRLLSIMMLLQSRGLMTARQLSFELEVSERTIYRDVEALSSAGVPVFVERGPGGGISLMEDYRTSLTGLTDDEVLALLALDVPKPLRALDIGGKARAALLKLTGASSRPVWREEKRVRNRLHLDSTWWFQDDEPVPHISTLHKAVWNTEVLNMRYLLESQDVEIIRAVEPYALVAKAGVWHLVFARSNRMRVVKVADVSEVTATGQSFKRDEEFNLEHFWADWCKRYERTHSAYVVRLAVKAELLPTLERHFGRRLAADGPVRPEGLVEITLPFEGMSAARSQIMRYGNAVRVLSPLALRQSVADHACQIARLYGLENAGSPEETC